MWSEKWKNFYISLAFISVTSTFIICVSIYCCIIKCLAKQKYLLLFDDVSIKKVSWY